MSDVGTGVSGVLTVSLIMTRILDSLVYSNRVMIRSSLLTLLSAFICRGECDRRCENES